MRQGMKNSTCFHLQSIIFVNVKENKSLKTCFSYLQLGLQAKYKVSWLKHAQLCNFHCITMDKTTRKKQLKLLNLTTIHVLTANGLNHLLVMWLGAAIVFW